MSKVIIVGAGPSGMMAAISAAENGHDVHVYEKNDKAGKKLFITGKGRCNLTNACDMDDLMRHITANSRFLYSAFHQFSNQDTIYFFETNGLRVKVERGNRVFPQSDKSSDVIKVLSMRMKELGIQLHFSSSISDIQVNQKQIQGVHIAGDMIQADAVVIATGGLSYPSTGSTGKGFDMSGKIGHTVTTLAPVLVPFETAEPYVSELMGLTLKNIVVKLYRYDQHPEKPQCLYKELGEMLFTHFGVSGPLVLSASSYLVPFNKQCRYELSIDLKPGLNPEQLDVRLLKDFDKNNSKQLQNGLNDLLPKKLIPIIIENSGLNKEQIIHQMTKEERKKLLQSIKDLRLHITGTRGYEEAVVTRGGISVKEVNPSTMESKIIKNLYFAGEVLDLDGLTGGFNLQIAWSTGYVAGKSIL